MPAQPQRFRFRPRFKALAWGVVALGVLIMGVGVLVADNTSIPMGVGAAGIALGLLYLGSPAWRIVVIVDDQALEVRTGAAQKFRLPWDQVVELVASPATRTCFVNGGQPASSLLVPGPGASASYDIEHKDALFALLCERVPNDRIREVPRLDQAGISQASTGQAADTTAAGDQAADTTAAEATAATGTAPAEDPGQATAAEATAATGTAPAEDPGE